MGFAGLSGRKKRVGVAGYINGVVGGPARIRYVNVESLRFERGTPSFHLLLGTLVGSHPQSDLDGVMTRNTSGYVPIRGVVDVIRLFVGWLLD